MCIRDRSPGDQPAPPGTAFAQAAHSMPAACTAVNDRSRAPAPRPDAPGLAPAHELRWAVALLLPCAACLGTIETPATPETIVPEARGWTIPDAPGPCAA